MSSPIHGEDPDLGAEQGSASSPDLARGGTAGRPGPRRTRALATSLLGAGLVLVAGVVVLGAIGLWRLVVTDGPVDGAVPSTAVASAPETSSGGASAVLPESSCGPPQPALVVYFRVAAEAGQIDAVHQQLDATPGVSGVTYIDQRDAYREFGELFRDSPEMVASVRPEDLPPSLRVVLHDGEPADQVAAAVADLAGVQRVVLDPCLPPPGGG